MVMLENCFGGWCLMSLDISANTCHGGMQYIPWWEFNQAHWFSMGLLRSILSLWLVQIWSWRGVSRPGRGWGGVSQNIGSTIAAKNHHSLPDMSVTASFALILPPLHLVTPSPHPLRQLTSAEEYRRVATVQPELLTNGGTCPTACDSSSQFAIKDAVWLEQSSRSVVRRYDWAVKPQSCTH